MDKCVDIKQSLLASNGKVALAAALLDMLLAELAQNHIDISCALAEARFDDALESVHKLHGNCCYCGVPALKEACKKLEQQLRIQKHMPTADALQVFNEAVCALLAWRQTHDIPAVFLLDK